MMDVKVIAQFSMQFAADEVFADRLMDEFAALREAWILVRHARGHVVPAGHYRVSGIKGWIDPAEGTMPRMVELVLTAASPSERAVHQFIDFEEVIRRYERAVAA